ncbi:MAG: hypothetical protein ACJ731_07315 [Vicinamibacterales bacterium]
MTRPRAADGHATVDANLDNLTVRAYFHDHVRIEQMICDGAPNRGADGCLYPDLSRLGLGLKLKRSHANRFEVR